MVGDDGTAEESEGEEDSSELHAHPIDSRWLSDSLVDRDRSCSGIVMVRLEEVGRMLRVHGEEKK